LRRILRLLAAHGIFEVNGSSLRRPNSRGAQVATLKTSMAIRVQKTGETTFQVTVDGNPSTVHTVTVSHDYWQKLTGGRVSMEMLVQKSFEFLLERESNTSILRSFDLPVIQRYFSEYERTISQC
jgi:hypothetical protein